MPFTDPFLIVTLIVAIALSWTDRSQPSQVRFAASHSDITKDECESSVG